MRQAEEEFKKGQGNTEKSWAPVKKAFCCGGLLEGMCTQLCGTCDLFIKCVLGTAGRGAGCAGATIQDACYPELSVTGSLEKDELEVNSGEGFVCGE